MIRALVTIILPLLLPTLLYVLWVIAMRRAETAGVAALLQEMPWPWLAAAGLLLVAGVLVLVSMYMGSGGRGEYVPPRAVDGLIVPGHIEPAAPAHR